MSDATVPEVRMTLVEAAQLRFLEPSKCRFFMAGATLRLTIEDESCWPKVTVRRAFPLSLPLDYLSVRDSGNGEVGMLRSLASLDEASRQVVERELARRYVVSRIQQVVNSQERFGTVDWVVETDRGRCRFTTRDMRENSIAVGPGHYLITDVENNRYEVVDLAELDAQSQTLLMRHL